MRIIWSPFAIGRVGEIAEVMAVDRPDAAERWVRAIFARVAQLRAHPASGRMVPELARSEICQLPHPPYRVIYRIDVKRIVILSVRHGREELDAEEVRTDVPRR